MTTITLFEHQTRSYRELGIDLDHPLVDRLDRLNEACGSEIIRIERKGIRATQFVGVVRLGEVTIQILPKIDYSRDETPASADAAVDSPPYAAAVDSASRNLLHLLSYTHDFPIREQDIAPLLTRRSDWLELLTRLFASSLHTTIKRGVERSYVRREDLLPVMRGRWQISRQLRERPHVLHAFDVIFDEFSADTPLNQVFRFAVERLLLISRDALNRRLLRDIGEWLGEVSRPSAATLADLDRVHFTRLNERFRPAFNLARLFLEGRVVQLAAGQRHTFAFVFDMNLLFQEFVGGFLARHRSRILPVELSDARIRSQSRGRTYHLAESFPDCRRVFPLRPDFLFTVPSGMPLLVLDTKYKQLDASRRNLGVSEDDMYQMLAYASGLNCRRTLLLYPQRAGAGPIRAQFRTRGYRSSLTVATVNLCRPLEESDGVIRELREGLVVSLGQRLS